MMRRLLLIAHLLSKLYAVAVVSPWKPPLAGATTASTLLLHPALSQYREHCASMNHSPRGLANSMAEYPMSSMSNSSSGPSNLQGNSFYLLTNTLRHEGCWLHI